MDAPAAVLAVVLLETLVGGIALLWLAPTWGAVRHGYEVLLGGTLTAIGVGAWAAIQGPLVTAIEADPTLADIAGATSAGIAATTALTGLAVGVLALRLPALAGRVLGILGVLVGLASLGAVAMLRTAVVEDGGLALGLAELLLGAVFLGAIWDGMVLGHWYLVERRLSNRYMIWIAWVNVAAVGAGILAVTLSGLNPVPCAGLETAALRRCAGTFSPILTIGNMTIVIGIGVLALIAIIAAFNVRLAREGGRSIQASTGMFYLAVILAPAAEFAAKVRYF